jgi:hypothetical protein
VSEANTSAVAFGTSIRGVPRERPRHDILDDGWIAGSDSSGSRVFGKSVPLILLAVLPLTIGFVVVLAGASILPYFSHTDYGYDPAYAYLFNGMGLMRGFTPEHVDHPGTPLQMLTGIVSFLDWSVRWLFGATALNFEVAVLNDSESYLLTISVVLLILNVVAVFYLGLKIARSSGSLAVAMLTQAGYLLFASQLPRFAYVSPEALTIFCAAMAMGVLSPTLFSSAPEDRDRIADPILVGFFLALGLISKITFLPVLSLMWLIPGVRSRLWCLASLLFFSVAFFGPALSKFSYWRRFMLQIVRHSQYYGDGPAEFIELSAIPSRLWAFWESLPVLYVGFVAAALVGILHLFGGRRSNRTFWQAGILCAIIFLGLLSAIKHYGFRYAIPSLAIVPPALAWSFFHFMKIVPGHRVRQAFAVAGVICAAALSTPGIRNLLSDLSIANKYRARDLPALNAALAQHLGAIVIGTYGVRNQLYAIEFGLAFANTRYQKMIAAGRSDLILYSSGNWLNVIGEGLRDAQFANALVEDGREVLLLLPEGIDAPATLKVKLLYAIPSRERLFQLLRP